MIEAALYPPPVDYDSGWRPVPTGDAVITYLRRQAWAGEHEGEGWYVRRLTGGAYLYRAPGGWQVVGKFYGAKTERFPVEYARQELEAIRRARAAIATVGRQVVRPYTLWQGIIFLEYVPGPTLEEVLASPPDLASRGQECLQEVARLLARLHGATIQATAWPDFAPVRDHALSVVGDLAAGFLAAEPARWRCLHDLVSEQAQQEILHSFTPVFTHGDATTGNFIFDSAGGLVALDWERAQVADPAADLGRLLAEVGHSLRQQRQDEAAIASLLAATREAYGERMMQAGAGAAEQWRCLQVRARFYEAIGMLRIARNAWVDHHFRHGLLGLAETLLTGED